VRVLMENREMARTHRVSTTGALILCLVSKAVLSAGAAGPPVEVLTWR
jgi:hypothetical protein